MNYFAFKIPNGEYSSLEIKAPQGIPSGPQFTIGNIASTFIQVALVIGIILSLMYLVYGGFFWIQASGDKQKWDKARRIILYAIMGLIVMSLALVIVNVVASAFGVKTAVNP